MKVINNGVARTRFREVGLGEVFSYNNCDLLSSDHYYMKIEEIKNYNTVDLDTGLLYIAEDTDIVEIYPDATIYMHPVEDD